MNNDLVPKLVTVYLAKDRGAFLARYRLRADVRGDVEALDLFWDLGDDLVEGGGVAPQLLVYADLLDLDHPRAEEQARLIHDRYLA